MGIQNQYNNLPVDVSKSLLKLSKVLNIIKENIKNSKEYILTEIIIEFGDLQAACKLFSLYYPIKGVSLSRYILGIQNKDNSIVELDVDKVADQINSIYDFINKLDDEGFLKADIVRTKIRISDLDWNFALRMIFSMGEYIDVKGDSDIKSIINYDFFLQYYEWMDYYIKENKNYDPLYVLDYYSKLRAEFEEEMEKKILDFEILYDNPHKFKINDLTYYTVDREKYRKVIHKFTLPIYLKEYVTILYKTKSTLKLLSRKEGDYHNSMADSLETYKNEFEKMLHDDLDKKVFSYFVKIENEESKGTIEEFYQNLRKTDKKLKKEDIERAIKNLILKGFISLKK